MIKIFAYIFISLTAILHCLFFKLESLDFMKPETLRKFGLNEETGKVVKVWAFNQGFYNLFLAFGLFYVVYLLATAKLLQAKVLGGFILLTIVGAGLVLYFSAPGKEVPAMVQALPALIGVVLLALL